LFIVYYHIPYHSRKSTPQVDIDSSSVTYATNTLITGAIIIQPVPSTNTPTTIAAPSTGNAPKPCNICRRQVSGPDRQNHMGRHILCKLRDVIETGENLGTVSMQYPCGFCGQSSINGACHLRIVSGKAVSSCAHAYDFRISSASKISKQKPCTNVPIACKFCHDVHWKYNMRHHLQECRLSWESNTTSPEVNDFSGKISITNEEETKLGIPEESQGHSVVALEAYDARRSHSVLPIHDSHGDSPRRPRRTTPVQHPYPPPPSLHIALPVLGASPSSTVCNDNDVFC